MKKLVIVSTKVEGGKGGISTALQGYISGLEKLSISYQLIESHDNDKNLLLTWLSAFWKILLLSLKHRRNVVFWFHCGPWFSIFRKFTLAIIPRLLGCKTIAHIHSITFHHYLSKSFLSRIILKIGLYPFSSLILLTPWWQNLLTKYSIKKHSIVSPNPNSDMFCKVAESYIKKPRNIIDNKREFNILTMTRLVDGKGVDLVIAALAMLPEKYILTIAGDGPLKYQLEQQVKNLKLEKRVFFTGWIDGIEKENYLQSADVFCLPSKYDSFGMVFIEAMAFDLPVIAYGWGPINDVVDDEVGVCCLQYNVKDVTRCIEKVCGSLSLYVGKGPRRVLQKYTGVEAINNILKFLK